MTLRVLLLSLLGFPLVLTTSDGDLDLKLVQIVWRHGDRNPTDPYPGDNYNKSFWDERGGYGELTTRGMEMHVRLGAALRQRYIKDMDFLSPSYSAAEIYVRSTDVNRTIISAISNIIGMYGQGEGAKPGQYPDFRDTPQYKWPSNFVPVAVHTVDDHTDYLGNANAYCPRQDALWALVLKASKEVDELRKNPMAVQVQNYLNQSIGIWYEIDELWMIRDVLFIEHDNDLQMPSWWSQEFHNNLTKVNDQVEDFQDGIGLSPIQGINFTVEFPKLRAGALTNDMRMHMDIKLSCEGHDSRNCTWINNLKYFAYSAHDETIASFLATLGAKHKIVPDGYPLYSSAAVVELWQNRTDGTAFFKLLFHSEDGIKPVFSVATTAVTGCSNDYCSLDVFRKQADLYNPGDAAKLCLDTRISNQDSSGAVGNLGLISVLLMAILMIIH